MEHCYWNLLHPQAGIMLDSIPAPGDEFFFSIFTPEIEVATSTSGKKLLLVGFLEKGTVRYYIWFYIKI